MIFAAVFVVVSVVVLVAYVAISVSNYLVLKVIVIALVPAVIVMVRAFGCVIESIFVAFLISGLELWFEMGFCYSLY